MPKGLCIYFDFQDDYYSRLVEVFRKSWEKNSSMNLRKIKIKAPKKGSRTYNLQANTSKLEAWLRHFNQDTVFLDADLLMLKDIRDGFDLVDDVGITETRGRFPINGGVMFFKYTPRAKKFLRDLVKVNREMLLNCKFHDKWFEKYSGINQSAAGYLLESEYGDLNILPQVYNLCEPWDNWEASKIIHIKGELRDFVLHLKPHASGKLEDIRKVWKYYRDL